MKPTIRQRAFQAPEQTEDATASVAEPKTAQTGPGSGADTDTPDIKMALTHLSAAVNTLKEAVAYRTALDDGHGDLRTELSRLNEERKRLTAKLDQAEGRLSAQAQVTADVSSRLGASMEAIRSVLESQAN